MATANSRPTFSFSIASMVEREVEFPEEAELVREAERLVGEIIAKLKPCLKYVVQPSFLLPPNNCDPCEYPAVAKEVSRKIRTMVVGADPDRPDEFLLLNEDGSFIRVRLCSRGRYHDISGETVKQFTWHLWPFDFLIASLTSRWERLEQLKREHLDAVAARLTFLQKVRAEICGGAPKEVR